MNARVYKPTTYLCMDHVNHKWTLSRQGYTMKRKISLFSCTDHNFFFLNGLGNFGGLLNTAIMACKTVTYTHTHKKATSITANKG